MGWASERMIEMHNDALQSDADYRAEYEAYMADLDASLAEMEREDETDFDWFPEIRIAHDGFAE